MASNPQSIFIEDMCHFTVRTIGRGRISFMAINMYIDGEWICIKMQVRSHSLEYLRECFDVYFAIFIISFITIACAGTLFKRFMCSLITSSESLLTLRCKAWSSASNCVLANCSLRFALVMVHRLRVHIRFFSELLINRFCGGSRYGAYKVNITLGAQCIGEVNRESL